MRRFPFECFQTTLQSGFQTTLQSGKTQGLSSTAKHSAKEFCRTLCTFATWVYILTLFVQYFWTWQTIRSFSLEILGMPDYISCGCRTENGVRKEAMIFVQRCSPQEKSLCLLYFSLLCYNPLTLKVCRTGRQRNCLAKKFFYLALGNIPNHPKR